VYRNLNVLLCLLILLKLNQLFFFRFHIMSRDDRLGSRYSSDLYLRSWELERESSHRNLGLTEGHLGHQEDQQVHQKYPHDLRYPSDSTACVSTEHKLIFILNNQRDLLIIQIYFVIKFYMFRISSVPIIRSFLLYIRHW